MANMVLSKNLILSPWGVMWSRPCIADVRLRVGPACGKVKSKCYFLLIKKLIMLKSGTVYS